MESVRRVAAVGELPKLGPSAPERSQVGALRLFGQVAHFTQAISHLAIEVVLLLLALGLRRVVHSFDLFVDFLETIRGAQENLGAHHLDHICPEELADDVVEVSEGLDLGLAAVLRCRVRLREHGTVRRLPVADLGLVSGFEVRDASVSQ